MTAFENSQHDIMIFENSGIFCEFSCHSCGKRIRRWWRELQLGSLKHVGFCPSFLSMLAAKVWRETNRIYGVDFQKALRFATEVICSDFFVLEWGVSSIFDWNCCYCQRSCISGGL